jgi:hypothetical protein
MRDVRGGTIPLLVRGRSTLVVGTSCWRNPE